MILKPNMVVPGKGNQNEYTRSEVAEKTVKALKATVNHQVAGIAFLSGGLKDGHATNYLNTMNKQYTGKLPWNLAFSFGRELQSEPLKLFAQGGPDSVAKAQEQLLKRAQETSLATEGRYIVN